MVSGFDLGWIESVQMLFLMADQMRFDALGFVGRSAIQTPNLDRLAR
jgi:arylsulfatase A-like enzyme